MGCRRVAGCPARQATSLPSWLHPTRYGRCSPAWSTTCRPGRAGGTSRNGTVRCLAIAETDRTVRLLSRRGTSLNAAFPDLVTAAGSQLPAGTIADGDIVRWSTDGRLDFEALQRRNRGARQGSAGAGPDRALSPDPVRPAPPPRPGPHRVAADRSPRAVGGSTSRRRRRRGGGGDADR